MRDRNEGDALERRGVQPPHLSQTIHSASHSRISKPRSNQTHLNIANFHRLRFLQNIRVEAGSPCLARAAH